MKIEKGKLYYDTIKEEFFKSNGDGFTSDWTDKIAVHCPTKEDALYIRGENYNLSIPYTLDNIIVYLDGYGWDNSDYQDSNYHIITIDTFKQFYPESVISNKTNDNVQNNDPTNPTHYNQYAIQPLDYIEANGFDFCEGNVIKYVSRYKQKNGLEDLRKAQYYINRLIENYKK